MAFFELLLLSACSASSSSYDPSYSYSYDPYFY